MNKYSERKLIIRLSIILFLIEAIIIYLIIKSILTKDLISPGEVAFYEYIKVKLSNLL